MNIREITDCTDDTEMKSKFDAYVEWLKTNAEDPAHRTPEGALQLAHNNVGYFAGYYGFDKMSQVKRALGAPSSPARSGTDMTDTDTQKPFLMGLGNNARRRRTISDLREMIPGEWAYESGQGSRWVHESGIAVDLRVPMAEDTISFHAYALIGRDPPLLVGVRAEDGVAWMNVEAFKRRAQEHFLQTIREMREQSFRDVLLTAQLVDALEQLRSSYGELSDLATKLRDLAAAAIGKRP